MELRIVSVTEKNFDEIPRPAKTRFNCQECFFWIGKRDAKFDLVKQKKKWFGQKFPKYGPLAKVVLWGKRKKPVGYIQFGPIAEFETALLLYRDRLTVPRGAWCINCLSLQRPYQKKGVAKKLVRNILRDLKKRGVKIIDVYEMPEFWQRFGFETILEDKEKDLIILRKKL